MTRCYASTPIAVFSIMPADHSNQHPKDAAPVTPQSAQRPPEKKQRERYDTLSEDNPLICRGTD